jgi:hypothetical protein
MERGSVSTVYETSGKNFTLRNIYIKILLVTKCLLGNIPLSHHVPGHVTLVVFQSVSCQISLITTLRKYTRYELVELTSETQPEVTRVHNKFPFRIKY